MYSLPPQAEVGENPMQAVCPTCGHVITTQVEYKIGTLNYFWAAVLCVVIGHTLPCVPFIACCVKSFKDIEHSCPNDGTLIGVLRRRSPF